MYQNRNKIAPFDKSLMNTQQTYHSLIIKFLKPYLAKTNSESHFRSIWNNFFQNCEKEIELPLLFNKSKFKLILIFLAMKLY